MVKVETNKGWSARVKQKVGKKIDTWLEKNSRDHFLENLDRQTLEFDQLLRLAEAKAKAAKRGIWADPTQTIKPTNETTDTSTILKINDNLKTEYIAPKQNPENSAPPTFKEIFKWLRGK